MKKIVYAALVPAMALALGACGSSDKASEEANPDNVEMPADEAVGTVDPAATPVAETAAGATATPGAIATAGAIETPGAIGAGATPAVSGAPGAAAKAGAEAATAQAEKKM